MMSPASNVASIFYVSEAEGVWNLTHDGDLYDVQTPAAKHAALAILLSVFTLSTIFGNTLVILAVLSRQNLHTPTGYLIFSLATADLIVGLAVMPLNIVFEMYDHVWVFNLAVCDLWHSMDVLASTCSIWNLCVIAIDRCLAVSDPLNYPQLMSLRRVTLCIAAVWIGSALIAFPAVAWWRIASPELYLRSDRCPFTDDTGYLIFSSLLSFYIPLLIIIGAYGRVYVIAYRHQRSLAEGRKALPCNPAIYIRVHRGGRKNSATPILNSNSSSLATDSLAHSISKTPSPFSSPKWSRSNDFIEETEPPVLKQPRRNYGSYQILNSKLDIKNGSITATTSSTRTSRSDSSFSRRSRTSGISMTSSNEGSKRRGKTRASMLLRLLAKESKAAKTLGIVVGAFIACWLPFFVVNVLSGACGENCPSLENHSFRSTFTVVTWLGHCNSFLNPIIYTCFNREFRDAFATVLFCGRWTRHGRAYVRRRKFRNYTGAGGQNFCARKGLAKAIEGGLRVIVPQATNAEAMVVSTNITLTEARDFEEELGTDKIASDQSYSIVM